MLPFGQEAGVSFVDFTISCLLLLALMKLPPFALVSARPHLQNVAQGRRDILARVEDGFLGELLMVIGKYCRYF